jgi:hypothetical protein
MERAIGELAVGEALVSLLDAKGTPSVTERAWIAPPSSQIGAIPDGERERLRTESSRVYGHYDKAVDRESAYEKLTSRAAERAEHAGMPPASQTPRQSGAPAQAPSGSLSDILFGSTGPRGGRREGMIEAAAKSAARSVGSGLGRSILRGALGGLLGGGRRR